MFGGVRLGDSSGKTLLTLFPVDDFPHLGQVLGPRILVVKVVGVLPHVNVQERHQVWADIGDKILICGRVEGQLALALVVAKPAPARSLDGGRARVEHLNEVVERAPPFNDHVVEGARGGQG